MRSIACLAGLLAAGLASAEPFVYPSIEDAAKLTDQHALKFERDSISRQGDMLRFDLKAGWKNPEERPADEAPRRILRFLARCEAKELAIMGVAVFDLNGQVVKSYGIAPGGWDFVAPAKDSIEGQYLAKVCSSGM